MYQSKAEDRSIGFSMLYFENCTLEGCKLCIHLYTLNHTIPTFNDLKKTAFENDVGKGENAGDQYLLLFP